MNKQFRITTDTLSPLFKTSIGFDNLVNEFFNEPQFANATGYPPYNISKGKDDVYEITLAIAGFKKSDIDIQLEEGTLKITGTSKIILRSLIPCATAWQTYSKCLVSPWIILPIAITAFGLFFCAFFLFRFKETKKYW